MTKITDEAAIRAIRAWGITTTSCYTPEVIATAKAAIEAALTEPPEVVVTEAMADAGSAKFKEFYEYMKSVDTKTGGKFVWSSFASSLYRAMRALEPVLPPKPDCGKGPPGLHVRHRAPTRLVQCSRTGPKDRRDPTGRRAWNWLKDGAVSRRVYPYDRRSGDAR